MNPRATRAQVGGRQRDVTPVLNSFFVTHPDSVRALLRVESFPGSIWEPAVGDGTMAHVLAEGTDVRNVVASDLVDRGSNLPGFFTHDFLGPGGCVGIDHVVTNPPFKLGERFVVKALSLNVPGKVAMFPSPSAGSYGNERRATRDWAGCRGRDLREFTSMVGWGTVSMTITRVDKIVLEIAKLLAELEPSDRRAVLAKLRSYKGHRKEFCEICKSKNRLGVHHKDENPTNNSLDNLQTLCQSCHLAVHHQLGTYV